MCRALLPMHGVMAEPANPDPACRRGVPERFLVLAATRPAGS
jgi:hypothetical protein